MKKQFILVLLAFSNAAVFAQNSGEENLPTDEIYSEKVSTETSNLAPSLISVRLDFGGILSPGYNPFGIGFYNVAKRPILHITQLRFELGSIKNYGFYYGAHLGLGQNFKIDNFDLYLIGNYGMTSVGVKEYKQHGRFLIWDYSVDLGARYTFKNFPQLGIFTEASYSGKKPIHIRLGLIIN